MKYNGETQPTFRPNALKVVDVRKTLTREVSRDDNVLDEDTSPVVRKRDRNCLDIL